LWIDDFVGKGLGADIVLKFIWYQSAVLVPLALPLAILLSSLMTFGNLGESFELVAIKSAGISLLRFMRPLFFVTILICGVAFLFSNYIIPVANLKSRTLLSDIVHAQPAFDLQEGVFYDKIKGFAIKIGKKEPNDTVIRDVIIYEQNNPVQDNFIVAKSGVMSVSEDKRFLVFNLRNGWRYEERGDKFGGTRSDYIRMNFDEYRKQFDLSTFQINWTPDSVNKNNEKVYSMRQLTTTIDSLKKEELVLKKQVGSGVYNFLSFRQQLDSIKGMELPGIDTGKIKSAKSLMEILPDSAAENVFQQTINQVRALQTSLAAGKVNLNEKERSVRKHKIEWHRKIVLSLACLVLFLIGAPLGSIIRKGGLGTPLIFAIIFFMVFYFSTTMGEKFAKEDTLTPFTGMWLATFLLVPIGLFLTYKAMRDSQLFNKEWYHRMTKWIRRNLKGKRASNNK
jgi:lipopolysaccharide export system permease protein